MVYPKDYEPQEGRDDAWWLLRGLQDIDKFSGPCRIDLNVSPSAITALTQIISDEITKMEAAPAKNSYEAFLDQQTLSDLRRLLTLLKEVGNQAAIRFDESGRPIPFALRSGEPVEVHVNPEWMKRVAEEDAASVRLRHDKRA